MPVSTTHVDQHRHHGRGRGHASEGPQMGRGGTSPLGVGVKTLPAMAGPAYLLMRGVQMAALGAAP